jgi:uncharacterized protein
MEKGNDMKVLSLTGGGMLGYIVCGILERVEKSVGGHIIDYFDIVGGVSVGSIIGGAIAMKTPADELRPLFKKFYKDVFGKKRGFFGSLFDSYYDTKNVEDVLKEFFGDIHLSDVHKKFMTYAVRLDQNPLSTTFWKSWKQSDNEEIYKPLTASSSALGFFQPYNLNGGTYCDGGFASNNPTMSIVAELVKDGTPLNEIRVLNLFCANHHGYAKPNKLKGVLTVAEELAPLFIYGGEDIGKYHLTQLLGSKYTQITPQAYLALDTNDFTKMDCIIDDVWVAHSRRIVELVLSK